MNCDDATASRDTEAVLIRYSTGKGILQGKRAEAKHLIRIDKNGVPEMKMRTGSP